MGWKPKKPLLYKFQAAGDKLEGVLLGFSEAEYGKLYDLKGKDGHRYSVYGSTDLDMQLEQCIDRRCLIEFLGFVRTKNGREMKSFNVQVWEEED